MKAITRYHTKIQQRYAAPSLHSGSKKSHLAAEELPQCRERSKRQKAYPCKSTTMSEAERQRSSSNSNGTHPPPYASASSACYRWNLTPLRPSMQLCQRADLLAPARRAQICVSPRHSHPKQPERCTAHVREWLLRQIRKQHTTRWEQHPPFFILIEVPLVQEKIYKHVQSPVKLKGGKHLKNACNLPKQTAEALLSAARAKVASCDRSPHSAMSVNEAA